MLFPPLPTPPWNSASLSLALAFGLETEEKLRQMVSSSCKWVLRSTSDSPSIFHLHIKEISKGHRVKPDSKPCSNGLWFDNYSIEMELLKEEIDLQQSFRLLLNLQEAWDYKVAPQKTNRSWIRSLAMMKKTRRTEM